MKHRENELIEKSRRGNSAAFGKLVNIYIPRIRRLTRSVCRGLPSEAEDVMQEAFLNAMNNIKKFKGRSDFGTWLYRITSNLCWKKFRNRKRKPTISLTLPGYRDNFGELIEKDVADTAPKPDTAFEREELKAMIGKALETLPDEFRQALLLSDLNDWSNKKIATELHISQAAVKSRLHRARALLKKAFINYHK